jgi:hypothetical protein
MILTRRIARSRSLPLQIGGLLGRQVDRNLLDVWSGAAVKVARSRIYVACGAARYGCLSSCVGTLFRACIVANAYSGTRAGTIRSLLPHMREFMAEQEFPLRGMRRILLVPKHNLVSYGVSRGLNRTG